MELTAMGCLESKEHKQIQTTPRFFKLRFPVSWEDHTLFLKHLQKETRKGKTYHHQVLLATRSLQVKKKRVIALLHIAYRARN